MLPFFSLLIFLQIIGESIVFLTGIPIPGPVIGMVLLLIGLRIKGNLPKQLETTTQGLLRHLSLLFIPAGVGVISYIELLSAEWLPISASLVVATLLSIAFTGLLMKLLDKRVFS